MRNLSNGIAVTIVIILLLSFYGCSSSDSDHATSSISENPVDFMSKAVNDARGFELVDIGALRDDVDLNHLSTIFTQMIAVLPIDPSQLELCYISESKHGSLLVLQGNFDHDDIEKLFNKTMHFEDYNNVTLWRTEGSSPFSPYITLMDRSIIYGKGSGVKDFIEIDQGIQKTSLYDNRDFVDVMNRLPNGLVMVCHESYHIAHFEYDGLLAYGLSAKKIDENTLGITAVLKFTTAQVASDVSEQVESDMINNDRVEYSNVELSQDGAFLKVTAKEPIPSSLQPLLVFGA